MSITYHQLDFVTFPSSADVHAALLLQSADSSCYYLVHAAYISVEYLRISALKLLKLHPAQRLLILHFLCMLISDEW